MPDFVDHPPPAEWPLPKCNVPVAEVADAQEQPQLLSALLAQQRLHEKRVERLLEQHLGLVTQMLSAAGDEVSASIPERLEQPLATLPVTFFGAEPQEVPPVADEDGSRRSDTFADEGASKALTDVQWDSRHSRRSSWTENAGMTIGQLEGLCQEGPWIESKQSEKVVKMITQHRSFDYFFQALIIANAIVLGVEQDWQARHVSQTPPPVYFYMDLAFACLFLIELVMRVLASGRQFYSPSSKDIRWNVFDTLLVCAAIVETALKITTDAITFDVSTSRLLRLLRLVRMVRIVRVFRFFKDLRVMVLSILASFRPLIFALLLLSILIYVFSICLLQFVNEELAYLSGLEGGRESSQFQALTSSYGSLSSTSYTLFQSISNGVSWGKACEPIFGISRWLGCLFVMYIAFCMFCVLNIITAIFLEEASAMAASDEETMMIHEVQMRKRFVSEVKKFFHEADKDGNGQLSWEEFEERLQHVRVQKLLDNLGIDIIGCGARNVFEIFDNDGNGSIAIGEFTTALTQMRGTARSIDLASLRQENRKLRHDVATILRHITGEAQGGSTSGLL